MADISTYLKQILSAVYGEDVRQAIHDAIQQCYTDGSAVSDAVADVIEAKVQSTLSELVEDGTLEVNMSIEDDSITEAKIQDEAVTESKISDGAVSESKIADEAITPGMIKGASYTYHGLNTINYSDTIAGYTINSSTGAVTASSSYRLSQDIDVSGYAYVAEKGTLGDYLHFYDSDDTWISSVALARYDPTLVEIPSDATKMIVSFGTSSYPIVILTNSSEIASAWSTSTHRLLSRYRDNNYGNVSIGTDFPGSFSNDSIPLSAIKETGMTMYNLFNPELVEIDGTEIQILAANPSVYYEYFFSSTNGQQIAFTRLYYDGYVATVYANAFSYATNGYKPNTVDFTDYDAEHGEIAYTSIALRYADSDGSYVVSNSTLVISGLSTLTEYCGYGEYGFEPTDNMKRLIQAGQGDIAKVYDSGVMLTLGDSYTAYMNSYYKEFTEKHGLVQDNRGVASSTIAGDTGGNVGYQPMWNRLDTVISEYTADDGYTIDDTAYTADDVKLIVFMGGANDWSTVNDTADRFGQGNFETDKEKLYGALNYIFAQMLINFPNADIICILQPTNYNSAVPSDEDNATSVGFESLEQAQGMTDAQYSVYLMQRKERIVREMAEFYGIPICDCCFEWYNPCNPNDAATYWQSDKLHLTVDGWNAIIDKLENTVNNLPFER